MKAVLTLAILSLTALTYRRMVVSRWSAKQYRTPAGSTNLTDVLHSCFANMGNVNIDEAFHNVARLVVESASLEARIIANVSAWLDFSHPVRWMRQPATAAPHRTVVMYRDKNQPCYSPMILPPEGWAFVALCGSDGYDLDFALTPAQSLTLSRRWFPNVPLALVPSGLEAKFDDLLASLENLPPQCATIDIDGITLLSPARRTEYWLEPDTTLSDAGAIDDAVERNAWIGNAVCRIRRLSETPPQPAPSVSKYLAERWRQSTSAAHNLVATCVRSSRTTVLPDVDGSVLHSLLFSKLPDRGVPGLAILVVHTSGATLSALQLNSSLLAVNSTHQLPADFCQRGNENGFLHS